MSEFDQSYFPKGQQVQLFSEDPIVDERNYGYRRKPAWLGFSHGNKPYKLENDVITNPYLERAFTLKQTQTGASTMTVYHGTIGRNVHSIAANNFNWRLAGRSRGVKHGRGVCFSKRKSFTQQFCKGPEKCIIEAKILHRIAAVGFVGDILPRDGYDTARSPNGNVLVKFEDSDFIPLKVFKCKSFHYYDPFNFDDFMDALDLSF